MRMSGSSFLSSGGFSRTNWPSCESIFCQSRPRLELLTALHSSSGPDGVRISVGLPGSRF